MFDEVTKRETGKYAARRAGWVFGSTAFQLAIVALAIIAGSKIKAAVEEKAVDVKFVKMAAPPPPPPPPAPPPPKRKPDAPKPPSDQKLPPPPPPQALIQPKEVQEEMKVNPSEPKEPQYDYGANAGEGVVGGAVGARNDVEEAPAYAVAGFVKPAEKEKGCVGRSTRIPKELQGLVSDVTIKFAIGRDGTPSMFQVLSDTPDKRINEALWQAVQSCHFSPGTDPRGQPQKIWATMKIRFTSG